MKTEKILVFTLAVIALTITGCSQRKAVEGTTQGQIDSVSYAMGINFGNDLMQAGMEVVDLDIMMAAIQDMFEYNLKTKFSAEYDNLKTKLSGVEFEMQDLVSTAQAEQREFSDDENKKLEKLQKKAENYQRAINKKEPRFEPEEAEKIIRSFLSDRREFMSKKNLEEGAKFLEDNKKNVDVVELPNGLQYKIITQGEGAKPAAQDTVKVHYCGTTVDGKEFASSYKTGEPAIFPLNRVIVGWTEGLQELNEGTKAMLYIPAEMAYGTHGWRTVAPNAVLIFEVELLEVRPAQPQPETIK